MPLQHQAPELLRCAFGPDPLDDQDHVRQSYEKQPQDKDGDAYPEFQGSTVGNFGILGFCLEENKGHKYIKYNKRHVYLESANLGVKRVFEHEVHVDEEDARDYDGQAE